MIKLKIKKGDNVKVITGDDKGKTGNVIKVFPDIRKVLVKGINEKKKHQKPTREKKGGPRKKSFCARMSGMKKKLTSSKTANDPDSRINKALRKWKC